MTIQKDLADNTLTLAVEGRLDTTTAPELEAVLKDIAEFLIIVVLIAFVFYVWLRIRRFIIQRRKEDSRNDDFLY